MAAGAVGIDPQKPQTLIGVSHAEDAGADIRGARVWRTEEARGRTHAQTQGAEGAATAYASFPVGWPLRIDLIVRRIAVLPIGDPFPDIAVHIV